MAPAMIARTIEEAGPEDRRWPRQDVILRGSIRVLGTRGSEILVHNVSKTGLMGETELLLPAGVFVEISLPGFEPAKARVVWSERGRIGVKFLAALAEPPIAT